LEDRLLDPQVSDAGLVERKLFEPIDWGRVAAELSRWRGEALSYLDKNLCRTAPPA
jgi:hypothetical protein